MQPCMLDQDVVCVLWLVMRATRVRGNADSGALVVSRDGRDVKQCFDREGLWEKRGMRRRSSFHDWSVDCCRPSQRPNTTTPLTRRSIITGGACQNRIRAGPTGRASGEFIGFSLQMSCLPSAGSRTRIPLRFACGSVRSKLSAKSCKFDDYSQ